MGVAISCGGFNAVPGLILGDLRQILEVAANNGVHEHVRILLGVAGRHVHDVRLHHDGAVSRRRGVQRRDGPVVQEPVVAADHAEADDVALVVEDLEALRAAVGGQARDDLDLPEGADVAVADDDVAALDEVLVGLRVVEAADHRPDRGHRGGDLLDHGGAALVGSHGVGVVPGHRLRQRTPLLGLLLLLLHGRRGRVGGGGRHVSVGVDSVNQN